jgi:cyclopropane-fatty-acyl-phospholipid synthase
VERIARAGLSDRVEIKLQDYRDERGSYDGIASIEMFEAVGERYWPVYFEAVRERLKPGRNATLQIITVAGGALAAVPAGRGFHPEIHLSGRHAARALGAAGRGGEGGAAGQGIDRVRRELQPDPAALARDLHRRWAEVRTLGFDDRFKRMWDFYLASCAGAFQGGNCDVTQITVTRPS